jgi:N-acylneuraminate cytidylyltransferase
MALLAGRPLIEWTIDTALASRLDRVVVSTDDEQIATTAQQCGAEVVWRPAHLATDTATSYAAIYHALETVECDTFFRLQPTSPFRSVYDIDHALCMVEEGAGAVIGVTAADPHPYQMVRMVDERIVPFTGREERAPRQQHPPVYAITGSVYAVSVSYWRHFRGMWGPRTHPMLIPPERALDIDTLFDLQLARGIADDLLLRPGRHAMPPARRGGVPAREADDGPNRARQRLTRRRS